MALVESAGRTTPAYALSSELYELCQQAEAEYEASKQRVNALRDELTRAVDERDYRARVFEQFKRLYGLASSLHEPSGSVGGA